MAGGGRASCIPLVLGFLGGGVYACNFGLLVGTVRRVKGAGPAGGCRRVYEGVGGWGVGGRPVLTMCTGWLGH